MILEAKSQDTHFVHIAISANVLSDSWAFAVSIWLISVVLFFVAYFFIIPEHNIWLLTPFPVKWPYSYAPVYFLLFV